MMKFMNVGDSRDNCFQLGADGYATQRGTRNLRKQTNKILSKLFRLWKKLFQPNLGHFSLKTSPWQIQFLFPMWSG